MKLRYPQEGGHEYSASEYNVIRILNVRCGHRTLRFVIIKVYSVWVDVLRQSSIKAHSVGVDDHIDPWSGERVSPVSPAGRQGKISKKTAAPKDATVSFLSVYKRFNLFAQKNGDYHLRTVKGDIGNNSGQKCLLEVHACLICKPERTEKITHCRAQCHAQK